MRKRVLIAFTVFVSAMCTRTWAVVDLNKVEVKGFIKQIDVYSSLLDGEQFARVLAQDGAGKLVSAQCGPSWLNWCATTQNILGGCNWSTSLVHDPQFPGLDVYRSACVDSTIPSSSCFRMTGKLKSDTQLMEVGNFVADSTCSTITLNKFELKGTVQAIEYLTGGIPLGVVSSWVIPWNSVAGGQVVVKCDPALNGNCIDANSLLPCGGQGRFISQEAGTEPGTFWTVVSCAVPGTQGACIQTSGAIGPLANLIGYTTGCAAPTS